MKKNNFNNLLKKLKPAVPPADLLDKILFSIEQEQKMALSVRLKVRLIFSSVITLAMIAFLLPVWNWFQGEITQTGFAQFASLIFSDLDLIINYWQDFALSLLESLPFYSLAGILAVVFILLFSGRYMLHDIRTFFSSRHLPLLKI